MKRSPTPPSIAKIASRAAAAADTQSREKLASGIGGTSLRGARVFSLAGYTDWQALGLGGAMFATTYSVTNDGTAPEGSYVELTGAGGGGPALGDEIGFGMPLGPQGSLWYVIVTFFRGTNYGQMQPQFATVPMDATSQSLYGGLSIADPTVAPAPTFYNLGASQVFEGYNAVGSWVTQGFRFWTLGADGSMLSADAVSSSGIRQQQTPTYEFATGGCDETVFWLFKLKVTGKHASSTGYKTRIASIQIRRATAAGRVV